MAIVWPCPLTVDAYADAGREVEVPRPDCPSCAGPVVFWSGYRRYVRSAPVPEDLRAAGPVRALRGDSCAAPGVRAGRAAGYGGGDRRGRGGGRRRRGRG